MFYHDHMQQTIELKAVPKRIVSLVPSQSEYLWHLGLAESLVGITKFCVHPEKMFRTVTRVGGTKDLHLDKILSLKPDIIIGNKEENDAAQIHALQKHCPVWMSDIVSTNDAYRMMLDLGQIFNKEFVANILVQQIQSSLAEVKHQWPPLSVAYFIWEQPYMLAANDTFIDSMLSDLGLVNVVKHLTRYPLVNENELRQLNPDLCFLPSEPFPFRDKHRRVLQSICPNAKILLVDGEMFSWYGSRMLQLPNYVRQLMLGK